MNLKCSFLLSLGIISGCVSAPYKPIDFGALPKGDKIAIVTSIPDQIKQSEYTLKVNWSGSSQTTSYHLDTVPIAHKSLVKFLELKTKASVVLDKKKSEEVKHVDLNSQNPYTLGALSRTTVDQFSGYGLKMGYSYLAFLEGEREANVIRGSIGNTTPFYGIGIHTESGRRTYVYASLRLNILNPLNKTTVYSEKCFVYRDVSDEVGPIDQKVKLTNGEVLTVERFIPQVIDECVRQLT